MHRLRCAGRYFDADLARHDPGQMREALRDAKVAVGHAECMCITPPRRLVIRERLSKFSLAVWPEDGHHHDVSCPFYRDAPTDEETDGDNKPAVLDLGDGRCDIRLDFSLTRSSHAPSPTAHAGGDHAKPQSPRPSRARMPMLGLLQYLWSESSLNRWGWGWKRDYWRTRQQLMGASDDIDVGGKRLVDLVYMPPEFRRKSRDKIDQEWAAYRDGLFASLDSAAIRSGIVIGEVRELEPARFGFRLALRHLGDWFYLSEQLHQQLLRKYVRAMTHKRKPGEPETRVMVLAQVEMTQGSSLRVVDAALMVTSRDYIPVDSMHEALVANLLVDENRTFTKPLRQEESDTALPDFVLQDTRPETVMEVFGMNTALYVQRKAEKMKLYEAQHRRLWVWDATLTDRIPVLPGRWSGTPLPAA